MKMLPVGTGSLLKSCLGLKYESQLPLLSPRRYKTLQEAENLYTVALKANQKFSIAAWAAECRDLAGLRHLPICGGFFIRDTHQPAGTGGQQHRRKGGG